MGCDMLQKLLIWFLLIFIISAYSVNAETTYTITPSTLQTAEVYAVDISGTTCSGFNDIYIYYDSTNVSFIYHNSSFEKIAFVSVGESVYYMSCDNGGVPKNNSDVIFRWMDCDGSSTDASDWTTTGGTASCQSSITHTGDSFLFDTGGTGTKIASLLFPVQTTGDVTVTGWYTRKAIVSYEGWAISPGATDISNSYWMEDNGNIRWYDSAYIDTGKDSVTNNYFVFSMSVGIDSNLGKFWQNNSLGAGTPTHRGTVNDLDYFFLRPAGANDGIYLDDLFICDGTCHLYVTPATFSIILFEPLVTLPVWNDVEFAEINSTHTVLNYTLFAYNDGPEDFNTTIADIPDTFDNGTTINIDLIKDTIFTQSFTNITALTSSVVSVNFSAPTIIHDTGGVYNVTGTGTPIRLQIPSIPGGLISCIKVLNPFCVVEITDNCAVIT